MAGNLNRVMLIGRLTDDPETRYTSSTNEPVASFSLVTTRKSTDAAGQLRDYSDFHQVVAFNSARRQLADFVAGFCRQGQTIYVEGRLHSREWTGGNGTHHKVSEVVATEIRLLSRKDELPLHEEEAAV